MLIYSEIVCELAAMLLDESDEPQFDAAFNVLHAMRDATVAAPRDANTFRKLRAVLVTQSAVHTMRLAYNALPPAEQQTERSMRYLQAATERVRGKLAMLAETFGYTIPEFD